MFFLEQFFHWPVGHLKKMFGLEGRLIRDYSVFFRDLIPRFQKSFEKRSQGGLTAMLARLKSFPLGDTDQTNIDGDRRRSHSHYATLISPQSGFGGTSDTTRVWVRAASVRRGR